MIKRIAIIAIVTTTFASCCDWCVSPAPPLRPMPSFDTSQNQPDVAPVKVFKGKGK